MGDLEGVGKKCVRAANTPTLGVTKERGLLSMFQFAPASVPALRTFIEGVHGWSHAAGFGWLTCPCGSADRPLYLCSPRT